MREKLLLDAALFNVLNPDYGFVGDPAHPLGPSHPYSGNYVGYLIHAGMY